MFLPIFVSRSSSPGAHDWKGNIYYIIDLKYLRLHVNLQRFFAVFSISPLKTLLFVQTNQVLRNPLSHGKQMWCYSTALTPNRYSWFLDISWRYPKNWMKKHLLHKHPCPSFLRLNSNNPKVGAAVLFSHVKDKTRSLNSLIVLLKGYNPLLVLMFSSTVSL